MSPRQLILKLLDRHEQTDSYADLVLENELQKQRLSEQDKALVQEIFFGVIRGRKRLDWLIHQFYQGSYEKAPRFIRHILQSSLYQLLYMDRIPDYAAIHEAVALAILKGGPYWARKINAILRSFQRDRHRITLPDRTSQPMEFIAVQYSHPEWMVARWIKRWGIEETISLCEANNTHPHLSLRVNRLKTTVAELQNLLSQFNVPTTPSPFSENFLQAERLPDLSQFEPFQQGLFSIQDVSAGLACELLTPQPGEKIIDLCAAPGGKTTYIAELIGDQGNVFAVDRNLSRLRLIRHHLSRLGCRSIHLVQADGAQFSCQNADRVIVDAPCSGLGVLAKRVDLRWKRRPEQIEELSHLQLQLLINASKLVKRGGVLVYCTCTIEPEENEEVVQKFLQQHKQFRLDAASNYVSREVTTSEGFVCTYPHRHGIDGSFAVRLINQ